ncbi:MAG: hypothetical protein LUD50_03020 [Clostridia bacterium]|nr:hypothetical protein [Clostridia bacterium]
MNRQVQVELIITEGYQERFTMACIRTAQKRLEAAETDQEKEHEEAV